MGVDITGFQNLHVSLSQDNEDGVSVRFLVASVFLHGAIILAAIIGLPYMTPDLPPVEDTIVVELVEVSDQARTTQIREAGSVRDIKPKQTKKAPEPVKKAAPQVTSDKPPSPFSAPKPSEDAIAPPDAPPPMKKPKSKPKEKKKPEERKPMLIDENLDPAEDDGAFESVLKNLLPDESADGEQSDDQKAQAAPKSKATLADRMTRGEMDALKYQLARCWNLMAGARYAEDLVVDLRIFVNRDRTVRSAEVTDNGRYQRDPHFRAAADSAMRAIRNPECSPLELPADKYDLWKVMVVRFDPREMLL